MMLATISKIKPRMIPSGSASTPRSMALASERSTMLSETPKPIHIKVMIAGTINRFPQRVALAPSTNPGSQRPQPIIAPSNPAAPRSNQPCRIKLPRSSATTGTLSAASLMEPYDFAAGASPDAAAGLGPSTGTTTPAKSSAVMRRGSLSLGGGIVPLCWRSAGVWRSGRRRIARSRSGFGRKRIEKVAVHEFLQRPAGLRIDGHRHHDNVRKKVPDQQAADEQHGEMRKKRGGGTREL